MTSRVRAPDSEETKARRADGNRRAWADPEQRARRIASIRHASRTVEGREHKRAAALVRHERQRALHAWVTRLEEELFPPGEVFIDDARRAIVRVLREFAAAIVRANVRGENGRWPAVREPATVKECPDDDPCPSR